MTNDNLIPLRSVGSVLDSRTGLIHPMMKDGTPDMTEDMACHIDDIEIGGDWWAFMSPEDTILAQQGLPPAGGGADSNWMRGLFQDGPCKRCGQDPQGHILEKATKPGGRPNIQCLG